MQIILNSYKRHMRCLPSHHILPFTFHPQPIYSLNPHLKELEKNKIYLLRIVSGTKLRFTLDLSSKFIRIVGRATCLVACNEQKEIYSSPDIIRHLKSV